MPFKLHELTTDDELRSVLDVGHEAYGNPFNGVWQITTGSSREECYSRLLSWHKNDPTSHWVFVTDEATGEVIGGMLWKIYKNNPYANEVPTPTAYWLPEGPMKQIGDRLFQSAREHRPRFMSKPHLLISYCFVRSDRRNRGAASLMLKWGTDKADELGLESFVESTDIARRAYEKHGFHVINGLDIDAQVENPSQEFMDMREKLGCPMHGWFMRRLPSTQQSSD